MDAMKTAGPARGFDLPEAVEKEIGTYETELHRFLSGQVSEKVFMEFRLRYGTYGQRQPGVQMQRIKIPLGLLDAEKMERLADCAEEYSDGISHITTRQDIQYHFVNILDTPDLFRRLAGVGITTREACGNTVRNVTACPYAGVCGDEIFDVTPYADGTGVTRATRLYGPDRDDWRMELDEIINWRTPAGLLSLFDDAELPGVHLASHSPAMLGGVTATIPFGSVLATWTRPLEASP